MKKYTLLTPTQATFQIDLEVITPVLQIEPTSSNDKDPNTKASMVRTKKRSYISEDDKLSKYPFFSANGFRGIMRRNITSTLFSDLEQKDNEKISVATSHLYSSGGGTSNDGINALNYAEKKDFRNKNPFLSMFGAGLSDIDGKLSVTDMAPEDKSKQMVDFLYGVRFDETERQSILTPLIDEASVEEYKQKLSSLRKENAKLRKLEDEITKLQKELDASEEDNAELAKKIDDKKIEAVAIAEDKGMSYQQVYKAEFIIPGTKLYSSIGTRGGHTLTDIETGMILHGLLMTSQQNIGSYSRIGWGVLNWHVKDQEGKTLFKTIADSKYLLSRELVITEDGHKLLAPFKDYVESLERDAIFTMK
jgi:CRISPR type IV-associated protein Csf2